MLALSRVGRAYSPGKFLGERKLECFGGGGGGGGS